MKTEFEREEIQKAFKELKKEISDNEITGYQYHAEDTPEGRFVKIELLIKPNKIDLTKIKCRCHGSGTNSFSGMCDRCGLPKNQV